MQQHQFCGGVSLVSHGLHMCLTWPESGLISWQLAIKLVKMAEYTEEQWRSIKNHLESKLRNRCFNCLFVKGKLNFYFILGYQTWLHACPSKSIVGIDLCWKFISVGNHWFQTLCQRYVSVDFAINSFCQYIWSLCLGNIPQPRKHCWEKYTCERSRLFLQETMAETKDLLSISDFYTEKTVFITGATGFLGKIVIEKLLRSCPRVKKIYLLTRTRRGVKPQQRIDDLLQSMVSLAAWT